MEQGIQLLHHPQQYRDERWHGSGAASLRQMVFGMNDGLVATVGLVAGLTFSGAAKGVVVGATLAAIIAAVASMALGSYLSTRVEVQYNTAQMQRERQEIEDYPEEELEEMRQIYHQYGMAEDEIQIFLRHFQRDKNLWLRLMLRDELGIVPESFENPWINAGLMALAVAAGSVPPLAPVLIGAEPVAMFPWVIVLSAVAAFVLGAITGKNTGSVWWRSGSSFLLVASIAAAVGMGAGNVIGPLFGH